MTLSPIGKYILVKLDPLVLKTESGIHLPTRLTDGMKQCRGTIVSCGTDTKHVLDNERVLLKGSYKAEFTVENDDDTKSVIVLAEEVVATIEENDEVPE